MNDLEERIVDLLTDQMQVRRSRIQLSTTLADDIGMDGDDAVEFFERFAEKFHVDITALGDHWHRHFGPEGGLVSFPPELLFASAAGAVAGLALHEWVLWIPGWLAVIVFVVAFWPIALKIYAIRNPSTDPPKRPITVQDLVDAATTGKWPLEYSHEESQLPSYYPSVVPPQR
jgi:acyl carrier protein